MKKTKLTRSLLAACSIVALTAVMYGCVHDGDDPPPPVVEPEPMPEPDPGPPADLTDTQDAAEAAATAAMMASDSAATAAAGATTATEYLATLQTGDDLNDKAMGGREAAMAARTAAATAMAEYMKAKAASEAAAAATTGSEAEAELRKALDAKDAAEAAAKMAADMAMKAEAAAKKELHIKDTLKWAGGLTADAEGASSIKADMGTLTETADDGSKTITGFRFNVMRENVGEMAGQALVVTPAGVTTQEYVQAVEAQDLVIGKTLETTDDKVSLTVIHSRASSKTVRVYAEEADTGSDLLVRFVDGTAYEVPDETTAVVPGTTPLAPALTSIGMYYEATPVAGATDAVENALDHTDRVGKSTKGKEVFSYVDADGPDGTPGNADDNTTRYVILDDSDFVVGGDTHFNYQHVDIMAPAEPDDADQPGTPDDAFQEIGVTATLPEAKKYSHIHFGVWAALGEAEKDGRQALDGLGTGWVQSIGDGMTERLGIGTVRYSGDWVAVIQRRNSTAKGVYILDDGAASLTANFDTAKFTGVLTGLATLSGTLSGNGFSGTTATGIDHISLDEDGTFKGEFSGHIYGTKGEEAAGVFDFSGGEAGSFRGAFGGTNQQ